MNEPKDIGTVIRARTAHSNEGTWVRYSNVAGDPWINERGIAVHWSELRDVRLSEDETQRLNVYFQMGLATGELMKQGEKAMPLEMIYRLMSGEKWEDLQ